MSLAASPLPPAGPWTERWLSAPRFAVYVAAAGGDQDRALALYEWNAQLSAALLHDVAHLEVGLRNAYDAALGAHWPGPPHWTLRGAQVFPPLPRPSRSGQQVDINARRREDLAAAIAKAGGSAAPPGKIVAELMFGFWRYLTARAQHHSLWIPCLHKAFPRGVRRDTVDAAIGRLHDLRNRVAHHEPLQAGSVAAHLHDLSTVATMLSPELGQYLAATTSVPSLLQHRP